MVVVNHHNQPTIEIFANPYSCGGQWGWSSKSQSIIGFGLGFERNLKWYYPCWFRV